MEDTLFTILLGICALTIQFFLFRIKEPAAHYVKILAGIGLLLLVWIDNSNAPFGPKLILTSIAFSIIWKEYLSLKKNKQVSS
jgi:hypothetical protein